MIKTQTRKSHATLSTFSSPNCKGKRDNARLSALTAAVLACTANNAWAVDGNLAVNSHFDAPINAKPTVTASDMVDNEIKKQTSSTPEISIKASKKRIDVSKKQPDNVGNASGNGNKTNKANQTNQAKLTTNRVIDNSAAKNSWLTFSPNSDVSMALSGYVMLDYDAYQQAFLENGSDEHNDLETDSEVRRARLSLKVNAYDTLTAKIQLAAENDKIAFKDIYLKWSADRLGYKNIDLTLGKQKEPFGFEKLLSSKNALMNERSMNAEAFSPGRSIGVSAYGEHLKNKALTWQLGYFSPEESDQTAVTGRFTYAPVMKKNTTLHLGMAFSERDLQGEEYRINQRLDVHTADSLIEGKKLVANDVTLIGTEFLWQYKSFTTLAEWQQATVITTDNETYEYDGSHIQLSYLFSGAKRKYKNGMLSSNNFTNQWELTARWSDLNLLVEDERAETLSLGVNYYLNQSTKVMANVIHGQYEVDGSKTSGSAVALRLQYQF